MERSYALTLCAPDRQCHVGAGTVSYFDSKGVCVWVFDLAAVDADDEVVPGLDGYVVVLVAKDLEAEGAVAVSGDLRRGVGVEAGYEAVESSEHVW